jgi:hypothetical protein
MEVPLSMENYQKREYALFEILRKIFLGISGIGYRGVHNIFFLNTPEPGGLYDDSKARSLAGNFFVAG